MTEYWVATKKHYCKVCKTWISGHTMNIQNHEMSARHIDNQRKMLQEMRQRQKEEKQHEDYTRSELLRIEKEAQKAMEHYANGGLNNSLYGDVLSSQRVHGMQEEEKRRIMEWHHQRENQNAHTPQVSLTPSSRAVQAQNGGIKTLPEINRTSEKEPSFLKNSCVSDSSVKEIQRKLKIVSVKSTSRLHEVKQKDSSSRDSYHHTNNDNFGKVEKNTCSPTSGKIKCEDSSHVKNEVKCVSPINYTATEVGESTIVENDISNDYVGKNRSSLLSHVTTKNETDMSSNFIPSETFSGRKEGFVFKKGNLGVGYYQDKGSLEKLQLDDEKKSSSKQSFMEPSLEEKDNIRWNTPVVGEWTVVENSEQNTLEATAEDANDNKSSSFDNCCYVDDTQSEKEKKMAMLKALRQQCTKRRLYSFDEKGNISNERLADDENAMRFVSSQKQDSDKFRSNTKKPKALRKPFCS